MKSLATAPCGHTEHRSKFFSTSHLQSRLRPALWLLCCALPLWLAAAPPVITPQGSFSGNTICPGAQATLTFTATLGTGPYTVRYTDGNAIRTQAGVVSGTPFNAVSNTTATKTYTLLKVTGADAGVRSSGFTDATATVTVLPRPDLQSLTLAAIAPVCPGADVTLKLNGFVQAQSFEAQTAISTSANSVRSTYAADLDGDGDLDVLSASAIDDKIAWYKNDGSGTFTAQTDISTSADGANSVYAADLDGDGDVDVLSASFFDGKIAWYKNDGSGGFVAQTDISTSANGAASVHAADLDGDGDMDVLSASFNDDKIAWYKNDGSGGFTEQAAISTSADGAFPVYAADLDGDGDMDVLSASFNDSKIAWYKNDGSGGFTVQTDISTSADFARSVYAADLDGDGDLDVLSASFIDDKIAWYKNDGSGAFTAQTDISTSADGAYSVHAADLDGDGDMDVLSASANDDKIAWYKNDGSGIFTAQTPISTSANGASSVYAADLDGDGDLDVLSASSADDKIAWYKNRTPFSGSATVMYTAGGGEPQTATAPVSMGMATFALPAPKSGTLTVLKVSTADGCATGSGKTANLRHFTRPDLQDLSLNPIAPVCSGADAMLKLNGFVQAQSFETQTDISTSADGAISVHAADLDGDGDLDVLSASSDDDKIAWYKNDGSGGFTAQTAINTSADYATSVYAADLDGDGDLDVLSASALDSKIAWYKNDGSGGFTAQTPISILAGSASSVYAADLDGDGDMDVLSASQSDNKIAWYKNNGSGGFTAQADISTSANTAVSVYAADLDGDGDLDVLSASVGDDKIAWYKNDGSGGFTEQAAISTTADGAASVYAADLDGDGDMDVLSASNGDDKIAWYKNDGSGGFTPQADISTSANGPTSVYAADLDGDGDMDVLSASYSDDKIAWYKNDGSGGFTAQADISTTANGASSVHAADLDGDGDLDVLSASANDDKIAWYKNRTPFSGSAVMTYTAGGGEPQTTTAPVSMGMATFDLPAPKAGALTVLKVSAADGCTTGSSKTTNLRHLPRPDLQDLTLDPIAPVCPGSDAMLKINGFVQAQSFETQTDISTSANQAVSVYAADLDGDGDLDVLSASFTDDKIAWYKNDGSGSFTAQTPISTSADYAISVYAADLDGDGDLDVLSASYDDNKIAWYKNDGSGGFTAQTPISTSSIGAVSVYAADLDGDGDMDVMSCGANDSKIGWYKNDGSGDFTEQTPISASENGAESVYAADLDGDGDMDVLSASFVADKIGWYKNDGSGGFTAQPAISTTANGARSVHAADLDGDGDLDVLSASADDDKIAWYKNDGSGAFTAQTPISTSADYAASVYAADLDGDGDMDMLSASFFDNKIVWYKNDGSGGFTAQTAISTSANGAASVYAADLDGDGDMDVLSASIFDNKIAWYENRTPYSGSATVMYDINGGAPQTASGTVSMGMASLTIPAPSAGTLTVTKVTNADGCSATASIGTPVTFLPPPTFSACPAAPVTANTAPNQCLAAVAYTVASASSPTPTLTYAFTGATTGSGSGTGSGSNFNKGNTTVTVTATNACGTPTCVFTVTVTDLENPSIVCPTSISKNTDPGQCSAVATYANPTFADNCAGAFLTRTSPANTASGSAFPAGTATMVNWKVTDAAGNMSICQFTVTVSDNQMPIITCPGNLVRSNDAGQCYGTVTYATPTATDNCAVASVLRTAGLASGSQFPAGVTTTVTWEATDNALPTPNKKSCSFTVKVNDTQAPSITCPANQTKGTDAGQCYSATTYAPPTMADNCAGGSVSIVSGLPSPSNFPKGINTVTWKATDAAGLTKTCTFRVTVNDTEAPSISCPGSQSLNTEANLCSAVATYTTPTVTDNCMVPPPTVVKTSGLSSGSVFPKGTNTVVWKATDGAALTKTCSFSITVADAQLPSINCPPNISATAASGQCTATVNYATPTATDNCAVQSSFLLSGLSSGSLFPQGVTTNTWRAIDNSGGSQTCAFTVTVACGTGQNSLEFEVRSLKFESGMKATEGKIDLRLAPNPATTEVLVTVSGLNEKGGDLTLFDAQGRAVWQQAQVQSPTSSIDVADLPAGLYFVTLRSDGAVLTKRLVVSRL